MKPIRSLLAFIGCVTVAPVALAATERYTIDPSVTTPEFEVAHVGFASLHGHFDKAAGTVQLDPQGRSGSVELTIDTTTVHMGSGAWAAQLRDPGLLNVAEHPTMTYRSDRLIFQDNRVVGVEGKLTLLGQTRPVFLDVNNFKCGVDAATRRHLCSADVSAVVKRSEFGLSKYLNEVSDDVTVHIPVEAYRD